MILSNSPRQLTDKELGCLSRFARFEISFRWLRFCLRRVMKLNFDAEANNGMRSMENNFIVPEPGILITRKDIDNALSKRQRSEITDKQLIEWATMLLLNDAYEFDGKDEDFIAGWLNEVSFNARVPTD